MSRASGAEETAARRQLVVDARDVAAMPWEPIRGQPGVSIKRLWKDSRDDSIAGMMRIEPGAKMTTHMHQYSVHHVWVSAGECIAGERSLTSGAYCFVPAGVAHDIAAAAPGCEIFYRYLRAEMD